MTPSAAVSKRLVILYGLGGLSDVGRHAILAALEQPQVEKITVITASPELLDKPYWECGCGDHTNPAKTHPDKVSVVTVKSWKTLRQDMDPKAFAKHFEGADAVISCLGHRQPGWKYKELKTKGIIAKDGSEHVIQAMKDAKIERAVVISSTGIHEDWPPMEWWGAGRLVGWLVFAPQKSFQDVKAMEVLYKQQVDWLDYLFVRPCGISEERKPLGKWKIQQEKYKDRVGLDMAKMDCARYMVQEALNPTKHKTAVVIGSDESEESN